ncbi:MAG: hypothetical protein WKF67_04110 [Rubrobacteraceae bacterium]
MFKTEPTLPFFPVLTTTDYFVVYEAKDEDGAKYEREWLHYVDAYEHTWNMGALDTNPVCSVTLLNEDLIKAPILALSLVSSGVLKTFLLYGQSGDYVFFDDSALPWVVDNGDYLTMDISASGGVMTDNGDYMTVDI